MAKTEDGTYINGSRFALARIVATLLRKIANHPDGINIPAALRPYTGFDSNLIGLE